MVAHGVAITCTGVRTHAGSGAHPPVRVVPVDVARIHPATGKADLAGMGRQVRRTLREHHRRTAGTVHKGHQNRGGDRRAVFGVPIQRDGLRERRQTSGNGEEPLDYPVARDAVQLRGHVGEGRDSARKKRRTAMDSTGRRAGGVVVCGWPLIKIVPESGIVTPDRILISVLLPAPFSPISA